MTQEDKKLLLKDLSARQLYKVVLFCKNDNEDIRIGRMTDFCCDLPYTPTIWIVDNKNNLPYEYSPTYEIVKPYLRPMSSMTEEEKKDILQLLNIHGDIDNEGNLLLGVECNIVTLKVCKKYLGELNKRMFDVCHMIEKGLALEAPEGMYNITK